MFELPAHPGRPIIDPRERGWNQIERKVARAAENTVAGNIRVAAETFGVVRFPNGERRHNMEVLPMQLSGDSRFHIEPRHRPACLESRLVAKEEAKAGVKRYPNGEDAFRDLVIAAAELD